MRIAVPKETAPGERRVALVPDNVATPREAGARGPGRARRGRGGRVRGRGLRGRRRDDRATPRPRWRAPRWSPRVQRPGDAEVEAAPRPARSSSGSSSPHPERRRCSRGSPRAACTRWRWSGCPRTTPRAGDGRALLAGDARRLQGGAPRRGALPRILPMMTTAAGTLAPAKVFVIGAGVAGLQAIATARRLGAVVSAFDVRPVGEGAGPVARRRLRRGARRSRPRGGRVREGARRVRSRRGSSRPWPAT